MMFCAQGTGLVKNPVGWRQPVAGYYIKYLHLMHTLNEWGINSLKS
jgi:hypothetical protein